MSVYLYLSIYPSILQARDKPHPPQSWGSMTHSAHSKEPLTSRPQELKEGKPMTCLLQWLPGIRQCCDHKVLVKLLLQNQEVTVTYWQTYVSTTEMDLFSLGELCSHDWGGWREHFWDGARRGKLSKAQKVQQLIKWQWYPCLRGLESSPQTAQGWHSRESTVWEHGLWDLESLLAMCWKSDCEFLSLPGPQFPHL
jgi:hypothetical protein